MPTPNKATTRKPNPALMKPVQPDDALAKIEKSLAAAFEATLGALYLDGGMAAAAAFLEPYLLGELGRIEAAGVGPRIKDAKSRLQELSQGALGLTPLVVAQLTADNAARALGL